MEYKAVWGQRIKRMKTEAITDFSSLLGAIRTAFPKLPKNYKMTYNTNEDDDQIDIQSQQDFQTMTWKPLKIKIFINVSTSKNTSKNTIGKQEFSSRNNSNQQISTDNIKNANPRQQVMNKQKQQEISAKKKQAYFSCKACGKNQVQGPRYRCLSCIDYDLCSRCYQDKVYKLRGHQRLDHEFALIENIQQWNKINFRAMIRALGPKQLITDCEEQTPITHNDIVLQNKNFKQEIQNIGNYYDKILQQNFDVWLQEFDNLQRTE